MANTVLAVPVEERVSSWTVSNQRRYQLSRLAESAMPGVVFFSALLAAFRAYFSENPWMYFFEDDFYYYLKIAQNLAHGSGSTFNGIVTTNGYHPLWLLVLTGFSFVSTRGWVIFFFVAAVATVSAMSTFYLADKVLQQASVGALLRRSLAAYIAIYALHLFYTGMEIILAVPLMFLAIVLLGQKRSAQRGFGAALLLGLTAAAMILSRLDLAIFAALLTLFAMGNAEVRRTIGRREICGVLLGVAPFAVYLAINRLHFGTWMPVSGMAKQMKFDHLPALKPWTAVYLKNVNNWLNLLPVHLALLSLPLVWRRLQPMQKVIFPAVLLFPFAYYLILSCVSDWQVWLWYLYPMRAALCVSFVVFSMLPWTQRVMRRSVFAVAVLLVVLGEAAVSKWWTDVQPGIYAAAKDIEEFSTTHPGVYAMGDRSGMVGYLMPYPVVQTEGLVMDRAFLEHIRRQDPLLPTLALYGARYYVGTAWKPYRGCFHTEEPFQAGRTSAHMAGDLCSTPVATWDHDGKRTLVFDLTQEGSTSPRAVE